MPAVSQRQRGFLGAAYARKKAGRPAKGDPKISAKKYKEFLKKGKK